MGAKVWLALKIAIVPIVVAIVAATPGLIAALKPAPPPSSSGPSTSTAPAAASFAPTFSAGPHTQIGTIVGNPNIVQGNQTITNNTFDSSVRINQFGAEPAATLSNGAIPSGAGRNPDPPQRPLGETSSLPARLFGQDVGANRGSPAQSGRAGEGYADSAAAAAWIGRIDGFSVLGAFADPVYFVRNSLMSVRESDQGPSSVRVPEGFVTVFASIPRIFWSALPARREYLYVAIVHDYMYWRQRVSKAEADLILKNALQELKVSPVDVELIYLTAQTEGQAAWDRNTSLKAAGEKRVLRRLPTNATTKWDEWKKMPDVF